MAGSTIQNLFPYSKARYEDYTVYPCICKFSAPVVSGCYTFNKEFTPPVIFGKLLQKQYGIIAGVMVSANCEELEFTKSVNDALLLQVLHGGNNTPVNMAPFPFANFSQAENFQLQWKTTGQNAKQEEYFKLSITGSVEQLQEMNYNELELKVIFNFLRVGIDKIHTC